MIFIGWIAYSLIQEVDLVTDLTQGMCGKVMIDDQAILPSK